MTSASLRGVVRWGTPNLLGHQTCATRQLPYSGIKELDELFRQCSGN